MINQKNELHKHIKFINNYLADNKIIFEHIEIIIASLIILGIRRLEKPEHKKQFRDTIIEYINLEKI